MKTKIKDFKFNVTPVNELAGKVAGNGQVVKRNGDIVDFNKEPIEKAIAAANDACGGPLSERLIGQIAQDIENRCLNRHIPSGIETIQDMVVEDISKVSPPVAESYQEYRVKKMLIREAEDLNGTVGTLIAGTNKDLNTENANKDPRKVNGINNYIGEHGNKLFQKFANIPHDVQDAVDAKIIYNHDMGYYGIGMHNCGLGNFRSLFEEGTVIRDVRIDPPSNLDTAANIAAQVIAQVRSCQYGGFTLSLEAFLPVLKKHRAKAKKRLAQTFKKAGAAVSDEVLESLLEEQIDRDIKDAMKRLYYQINTLMDTGGQVPFITVHMDITEAETDEDKQDLARLIAAMLDVRKEGVLSKDGHPIITTFPKLVYVTCEENMGEDAPFYWLTVKAAECSAEAMTPDYISAGVSRELKEGQVIPVMGCRSALNPYVDEEGNEIKYGRFNQGVCTINLPDIALSADGDMDVFWQLLDERMELVHKALQLRHESLEGTKASAAPILWQHGVYARLGEDDVIDPLLHGGYSTISVGYAGIAEMTKVMTGKLHTEPEGKEFALAVMKRMNDLCTQWYEAENLKYSIYGTPIESTTEAFAKALKKRFGVIEGITDKDYVTNSYHVPVTEEIDGYSKLTKEAEFQALSTGGAITYVETPSLRENVDAILDIIRIMNAHNYYAEINFTISTCFNCGSRVEHEKFIGEDGRLHYRCPVCGNTDPKKQHVVVRTCGYLGNPEQMCDGRQQDVFHRVYHFGR